MLLYSPSSKSPIIFIVYSNVSSKFVKSKGIYLDSFNIVKNPLSAI